MKKIIKSEVADRRRSTVAVKRALRELRVQLALLNHQVGSRAEIRDLDFDCLDVIGLHGPLNPKSLARLTGLHPATLTGILDRLERAGWIARDRDPADRRAVLLRATKDRNAEIYRLFAGMNGAMDELCDGYEAEQLEVIADFLRRVGQAGQTAADELAAS